MKRILMGAVAGAVLAGVFSVGFAMVKARETSGSANVANQKLPISPIIRCINLGNALDAPNEGDWTYKIEDDHIREIAAAGFDSVRLPVRWSAHAQSKPPYSIDPVFFARVEYVIDLAIAEGLIVVLDVHHYEAIMQAPDAHVDRLDAMWRQIAKRFRHHGDKIVYEVLNEATGELTNKKLYPINVRLLTTIRNNAGGEPWVILGGDEWGNLSGLKSARFPRDARTVLTFHDYGPFEFTHQGAEFTVQKYPAGKTWGSASDLEEVDALFEEAKQFGLKRNKPVFLGEFGVIKTVPDDQRAEWIEYYRRSAEDSGIGWCLWDFGAAFGIYDVETKSWSEQIKHALLGE